MKSLILFLFLLISKNLVADDSLGNKVSPDGKFAIQGTHSDLFIVNVATSKKLLPLLPSSQQGQMSNVDIQAEWSPDGKKVAVLVFYGTKLSEFLLYRIDDDVVHEIKYEEPDLFKIFKGKLTDENADAYENELGDWINNDTISLIYGQASRDTPSQRFIVKVKLIISGQKATVKTEYSQVLTDS